MDIGKQIRLLRKQKKITLAELSQKSGVALATLSRIETKRMMGTVESHIHIAEALGVGLPELYRMAELEQRKGGIDISNVQQKKKVYFHDDKSTVELLSRDVSGRKLMPLLLKIKAGSTNHLEKNAVGVEKFCYVLEGRLDFKIEDEVYHLKKGETIHFDSSLSHGVKNVGDHEALCLCVITPPVV